MRGFETFGDLDEQRDRFVDRHGTSRNALGQGLPFHELHDEELLAAVLFESVKGRDVRVVDLREEPRLALEAFEPVAIAR